METSTWLQPVLWVFGLLLPAVGVLSIILFNMLLNRINRLEEHVQQRLQSLSHEDRETRQQITGMYHIMMEIQKDCHKLHSD